MAVRKYIIETRDLGKLIRGETIDLAQKKNNIRGFEIEIIDNPTNGDMIKAMFPQAKIIINELLGTNGTVFVQYGSEEYDEIVSYSLDWWNSPYKGVEE
jgi:hypothetical protein